MQWLMKEVEWNKNGTKLEITVKLTDPEDPPVLKVSFPTIYLVKDSYRNGRNTPPTLIQNLKPVEISKNHFNII